MVTFVYIMSAHYQNNVQIFEIFAHYFGICKNEADIMYTNVTIFGQHYFHNVDLSVSEGRHYENNVDRKWSPL